MGRAQDAYDATGVGGMYIKAPQFMQMVNDHVRFLITGVSFSKEGKFGPQYTLEILTLTPESASYRVSFGAECAPRSAFIEAVLSEISETGEPYSVPCVFCLKDVGKGSPRKELRESPIIVGDAPPF